MFASVDGHWFSLSRRRVWIFGVVSVILTVLLTMRSINDQRRQDPVCQGQAGAGFPATFICDSIGSSPTGSWGRIDEADLFFPNLFFIVDVVFYTVLLWIPWFLVVGIFQRRYQRLGHSGK